jgi:hypothetical protein
MAAHNTVYLRVQDDGTNLNFSLSETGAEWRTVVSENRTAYLAAAPDRVGVCVLSNRAAETKGVFGWFRVE